MNHPLMVLKGIRREFPSGEATITVLKDIDLTIHSGEMVAIVGASGSGKSTLMNILGCLDRPTSGSYHLAGREVAALSSDDLAALRRERFGFIFQRYHLLGDLNALGNVEIPAIYAGRSRDERRSRAAALLGRLGMTDRTGHRPGQLSGGQQQRVSIARALMNDADIILADEPTGALDSQSGQEVLRILDELNAEGRTVIIVTHDMSIANRASRIIEISDGEIISDSGATAKPAKDQPFTRVVAGIAGSRVSRSFGRLANRFRESFRMALIAMAAHRLRTFLTMLGIVIGIASVVSVVALGEGSRQRVLANISSLGTNTLEVFAGQSFGDIRSGRITTLVVSDADALAQQSYVAAVTPTNSTSVTIRFAGQEASAQVSGVGEQYFDATGMTLIEGRFFDAASVAEKAQEVVIDENTRTALFADVGNPVGYVLFAGKVPLRVIGVAQSSRSGPGGGQNLSLYVPYTAVQTRMLGSTSLRSITVKVSDDVDMSLAEEAVTQLLTQRHGTKDFFIINTDDIRQTITSTTETLTLLIAAIAIISLVVGGIGVMNIMLVSVTERIAEIGVRMAVGARQSDIMQQFLIEAVLVCLIGGVLGILVALGFGVVFSTFSTNFSLVYSPVSIIVAFVCSSLIGVAFGFWPARNASKLDPVVALAN